jgi:hypothetical protein
VDFAESSRPFGAEDAARLLAGLPDGAHHTKHGDDHLIDLEGWRRSATGCPRGDDESIVSPRWRGLT